MQREHEELDFGSGSLDFGSGLGSTTLIDFDMACDGVGGNGGSMEAAEDSGGSSQPAGTSGEIDERGNGGHGHGHGHEHDIFAVPTCSLTSAVCSGAIIPGNQIPTGCATATREVSIIGEGCQEQSGAYEPSIASLPSPFLALGGDEARRYPRSSTLMRLECASADFNRPGSRSTGDPRDLPGGHPTVPQGGCSKQNEEPNARHIEAVGGIINLSFRQDDSNVVSNLYAMLGVEAPATVTCPVDLLPNAAMESVGTLAAMESVGTLAMDTDLVGALSTAAGTLAMDTGFVDAISTAAAGPSAVAFPLDAGDRVIDVARPSAAAFATTTTTTIDSLASLRSLVTDAAAQASPGRRPPTLLMRQGEPKLADDLSVESHEFEQRSNPAPADGLNLYVESHEFERRSNPGPADDLDLDVCDAVADSKASGRSEENVELIPGLIGSGKWRKLKGGVTMDSGCSIDTMPVTHAPNVHMGPVPASRANRRINAANGTRIKEHGVKQLRFRTKDGKRKNWQMLVTDVKKALKSIATTCDGSGGDGECHVLFTRHGGTIINVEELGGRYSVSKRGDIKGAGELTGFERTGNTYGMEAWVYVGSVDAESEKAMGFARPVRVP